jgi:hypothetical protein
LLNQFIVHIQDQDCGSPLSNKERLMVPVSDPSPSVDQESVDSNCNVTCREALNGAGLPSDQWWSAPVQYYNELRLRDVRGRRSSNQGPGGNSRQCCRSGSPKMLWTVGYERRRPLRPMSRKTASKLLVHTTQAKLGGSPSRRPRSARRPLAAEDGIHPNPLFLRPRLGQSRTCTNPAKFNCLPVGFVRARKHGGP